MLARHGPKAQLQRNKIMRTKCESRRDGASRRNRKDGKFQRNEADQSNQEESKHAEISDSQEQ